MQAWTDLTVSSSWEMVKTIRILIGHTGQKSKRKKRVLDLIIDAEKIFPAYLSQVLLFHEFLKTPGKLTNCSFSLETQD